MTIRCDWPEGVYFHYFIETELQTGVMFSSIALAAGGAETAARNRANACKAYYTALCFAPKVILTAQESKQIDSAFARLKRELLQSGESLR